MQNTKCVPCWLHGTHMGTDLISFNIVFANYKHKAFRWDDILKVIWYIQINYNLKSFGHPGWRSGFVSLTNPNCDTVSYIWTIFGYSFKSALNLGKGRVSFSK